MADETPSAPEKRVSPDGLSVAIRTIHEDDNPVGVSSWLAVNNRGISTNLTAAQVADWTVV